MFLLGLLALINALFGLRAVALAQGASVASASWLLFTDADTVHAPLAGVECAMRRSRFPAGTSLCVPIGLPVVIAIFFTSVLRYASGRGVEWRGRRYGRAGAPASAPKETP